MVVVAAHRDHTVLTAATATRNYRQSPSSASCSAVLRTPVHSRRCPCPLLCSACVCVTVPLSVSVTIRPCFSTALLLPPLLPLQTLYYRRATPNFFFFFFFLTTTFNFATITNSPKQSLILIFSCLFFKTASQEHECA